MPELNASVILSVVAGAGAAYVAVRVGLANVTTMLGVVVNQQGELKSELRQSTEKHADKIGALERTDAQQQEQINATRREFDEKHARLRAEFEAYKSKHGSSDKLTAQR